MSLNNGLFMLMAGNGGYGTNNGRFVLRMTAKYSWKGKNIRKREVMAETD